MKIPGSDPVASLRARTIRTSASMAIEGLIIVAVVGVAVALMFRASDSAATKARLSEIFIHQPLKRLAIAEGIALRGDIGASEAARVGGRQKLDADLVADLQGYGENRDRIDRADPVQEGTTAFGKGVLEFSAEQRDALAKFQFATDGANLLVRGRIGRSDTDTFVLPFTPSVVAEGPAGNILWLCGERQPPAGWKRLTPSSPTDMPDGLSFSVCREARH